jgi:hypothetical protein
MRSTRSLVASILACALGACGGSGGNGGPNVVDFEDRPDDGALPSFDAPVSLHPNATIVDVVPASALVDFSTADGFSLGACTAQASSGVMLMGVNAAGAVVTIAFDPPVRSVSVRASGLEGTLVEVETFDAIGGFVGGGSAPATCPAIDDEFSSTSSVEPVIASMEIRGDYVVFDDLVFE